MATQSKDYFNLRYPLNVVCPLAFAQTRLKVITIIRALQSLEQRIILLIIQDFYRDLNYPVLLCTDDFGIFDSKLSNEYYLAAKAYDLSKDDLIKIARNSIRYSFMSDILKQEVFKEFEKRVGTISFNQ